MTLVDTSVWVTVLRDKTGTVAETFHEKIGTDTYILSRFTLYFL